MIFFTYDYELKIQKTEDVRRGFLLKVQFPGGEEGFADCHPWHEFGDAKIPSQKAALLQGKLTPLLAQSLDLAILDAKARKAKRSLFANIPLLKSHLIAKLSDLEDNLNAVIEMGISHLKIKVRGTESSQLLKIVKKCRPHFKWRLDFNAALTYEEVDNYLKMIEEIHPDIDFIEDPCPYQKKTYELLTAKWRIPLALDFQEASQPHPYIVIHKPAVRPLDAVKTAHRVIVTSYLDHPVGQLAAPYIATKTPQALQEYGGWLSHLVYEPNDFSEKLRVEKGTLIPPPGTGFGFDDELEKLPWKKLA